MRNSKKVILSALSFVLIFCLISSIVIVPYYNSENGYYLDKKLREQVAGTIDLIVIGASHGLSAFDPKVIDSILGCNSYNLSGTMMTLYGKYVLLEKELKRNPVDTVVLELSYNTLSRDQGEEYANGDEYVIARLDSFSERLSYLFNYIKIDDIANIFSRSFVNGLIYWKNVLRGTETKHVNYADKGYYPLESNNVGLNETKIVSNHNKSRISTIYLQDNLLQFDRLVSLCKEYCNRVIITVAPISDGALWEYDNWDEFLNWTETYCKENSIEFFDFNLWKERYSIFTDSEAFFEAYHMSDIGAERFSTVFSETVEQVDDDGDVSRMFYSSYREMKDHSPYMAYLSQGE